jgi:hypothetical protein
MRKSIVSMIVSIILRLLDGTPDAFSAPLIN